MEIDGTKSVNTAINTSLGANSTQGLDQHSLGLAKNINTTRVLSQLHTNGRMFEQAVQNANKAGATPGSSNDNVKLSNSKVDQPANPTTGNPLTLNQRDARFIREQAEATAATIANSGETILKLVFKTIGVNFATLTNISRDTIIMKGKMIDDLMTQGAEAKSRTAANNILLGQESNLAGQRQLRDDIRSLAYEAFNEISETETADGLEVHSQALKKANPDDFVKEVYLKVFDHTGAYLALQSQS